MVFGHDNIVLFEDFLGFLDTHTLFFVFERGEEATVMFKSDISGICILPEMVKTGKLAVPLVKAVDIVAFVRVIYDEFFSPGV
jgi:hypothetical protein